MTEKATVKSASKVIKALKGLTGHSLTGVKLNDLAKRLGENPAQTFRQLQTLIEEGLAIQMDDGSYALGRELLAIAHAHSDEVNRAQNHITEHVQRVTARTNQIKSGS
ncbi:helix-turn-helix domain-containing protein [Acinetobacter bereziniae]|uniref:HTH-type transcriptional repressor AllR n=1 Tax=Acinetobacter bereziniae TaxID=106648 RepID=A0A8I1DIJ2_ACIBZ|nr:helix-turn-helix domain-containing protein [Acinetobacter bereziniae]QQC83017.1 helix-turn-helix domain-containing protein [Acinetobacter bereziniae]UUN96167.1 helix-turn-helix domain-containing protein [Acinetobacter bereziniae]